MSYNTPQTAQALVGAAVTQTFLDNARAIVDAWTPFRWEETAVVETRSGDGRETQLFLNMPIRSVTSLTVNGVARIEGTDFGVMKPLGIVALRSAPPEGFDNIGIEYTHGFTGADPLFPIVRGAEARIALYLMKNPAHLDAIVFPGTGTRLTFGDNHIKRYLLMVPTIPGFAK